MRALITNDDGIESHGLVVLAQAAIAAGLDVTVAAPSWDSSGASAALTAVIQDDGRLLVQERTSDDVPDTAWFGVEAAPAFIVGAALRGAFGDPPDVVLSGINRGPNTGAAVLHSGTVGAVFTAAGQGRRGMAISIDLGDPLRWDTAQAVADQVLPFMVESQPGIVLNVNVPNVPPAELRGLRRASLSSIGTVQATVTELGEGYLRMTYGPPDADFEPGSDAALLGDRFATFTPLVAPCEATAVDTSALETTAEAGT